MMIVIHFLKTRKEIKHNDFIKSHIVIKQTKYVRILQYYKIICCSKEISYSKIYYNLFVFLTHSLLHQVKDFVYLWRAQGSNCVRTADCYKKPGIVIFYVRQPVLVNSKDELKLIILLLFILVWGSLYSVHENRQKKTKKKTPCPTIQFHLQIQTLNNSEYLEFIYPR